MHFSSFLHRGKVSSGRLRQVLYPLGGIKKVVVGYIRLVVALYRNHCMGIRLGELNVGHFRRVVVLQRWLFEHV